MTINAHRKDTDVMKFRELVLDITLLQIFRKCSIKVPIFGRITPEYNL